MVTIYTNKDSDVNDTYPNDNYGSDDYFICSESSGNIWRSFVGFDITSIDVGTITAATLYLYCNSENDRTVNVHRITSSWTESGVTWNNKPTSTATNSTSFACITTGWKSVNILSMLQDQTGNEFGIRLTDSGSAGSTHFRSKEYDSGSVKAYLSITEGISDKYVDIATGSDSDSGNTWALAYLTVKKGIDNIAVGQILHIAEGNYSAQAAIDLNKNLEILCEDYGGGNASPPLTVVLPVTT